MKLPSIWLGALVATLFVLASECKWDLLSKDNNEDPNLPYNRYSSSLTTHGSHLFVSHGYFYDHKVHQARWLDCTWKFSLEKEKWVKMGQGSTVPSPRYGHSTVAHGDDLWFFGGDDGGTKHQGHAKSFMWGAYYNDLWKYTPALNIWKRVRASGAPPKRAEHAAYAIDEAMYVFGGLTAKEPFDLDNHKHLKLEKLNDVWKFDFAQKKWTEIDAPDGPEPRYGHAGAAHGGSLYVFGGYLLRGAKNEGDNNLDDTWRFDVATATWTKLAPKVSPPGRGYVSGVVLGNYFYIYGGGKCQGSCTCLGDVWRMDLSTHEWEEIPAAGPSIPIARYRQSMAAADGRFYVFGGESYSPYMYHNDVWRFTPPELAAAEAGGAAGEVPQL